MTEFQSLSAAFTVVSTVVMFTSVLLFSALKRFPPRPVVFIAPGVTIIMLGFVLTIAADVMAAPVTPRASAIVVSASAFLGTVAAVTASSFLVRRRRRALGWLPDGLEGWAVYRPADKIATYFKDATPEDADQAEALGDMALRRGYRLQVAREGDGYRSMISRSGWPAFVSDRCGRIGVALDHAAEALAALEQ